MGCGQRSQGRLALLKPCGRGAEHHCAWAAVAREHHLAAHDLTWILGHGSLDLADSCHVQAHAAVRAGLGQGRRSDLPSVQGCCLLRTKPSGNTSRLLLGHGTSGLGCPGLVKGIRRAQLAAPVAGLAPGGK